MLSIPTVYANSLLIGNLYESDIKKLVESATFETITSEIKYDINLDGRDEVILGVTCGNAGCDYYVFDRNKNGKYKYLGNLFFHPKAIVIDPESRFIKTHIRSNVTHGCDITYQLTNKGFEELNKNCK